MLLFSDPGIERVRDEAFQKPGGEKNNSSLPPYYPALHNSQSYITRNVNGKRHVRRGQAVDDIGNNISTYRTHVNKYLPGDAIN
jgi:hypothetical protein